MAIKTGQYAKVMLDVDGSPTEVMELREWSVSASSEKINADVAGEGGEWSRHLIGRKSWEGEATCISADQFWLEYMDDMVTIDFYDSADDLEPAYTGEGSLDFERNAPYDDIIESTLTITGNGALTHKTGV